MSDDRTLAPSPSRLKRAWRAGLRVQSKWLAIALRLAVLGIVFSAWPPAPDPELVAGWAAAAASPGAPDLAILSDTLLAAGRVAITFAVLAVAVHVVLALLTGSLGPTDARLRERLRAAPSHVYVVPFAVLTAVVGIGYAISVLPVMAGAARAADAPATALAPMFSAWVVHVCVAGAAILALAGLAELALERHRRVRSLYQSFSEAREEQKERA